MKAEIKYQAVLRGLNGLLRSKPIDINRELAGGPLYFAHVNRRTRFYNWAILPEPLNVDIKKLKFEFTGRVFWKNKTTAIYEYELTEI